VKTKTRKRKSLRHRKLHSLLAVALADLKKQEAAAKRGKAVINMNWWYVPAKAGGCCVTCLAGSVMANSLFRPKTRLSEYEITPDDYDDATGNRLCALNCLRSGNVGEALGHMGKSDSPYHQLDRPVASYGGDFELGDSVQWWADMEKLLADLQEANL
jgi:hypothetical protein